MINNTVIKKQLAFFALVFCCLSPSSLLAQPGGFALKPGDRVVFYGDSITEQLLYTTFVETFCVTRFPTMPLTFTHSGWGGDRVTGGGGGPIDKRLKRDVLAYKPTVMTIMLGMNDASYRPLDENIFRTYRDGYKKIVSDMKAAIPDLRLTLIKPSPFDDVTRAPSFPGGYNSVLVQYGAFLQTLAQETGAATADLNEPVVASLKRAFETDPKTAQSLIADRVHPGPGGQLLMALALLKAWHAPAVVSSVTITAEGKGTAKAENARISGLAVGRAITWKQLDDSLPFPVNTSDAPTRLALASSDFTDAVNQQILMVKGLSGSNYKLKIDGKMIGTFSQAQLSSGVNLALLDTPMKEQASLVHSLTLRHTQIHQRRWREFQVPLENDKLSSLAGVLAALDKLEAEVVTRQRTAAKPVLRNYVLEPGD